MPAGRSHQTAVLQMAAGPPAGAGRIRGGGQESALSGEGQEEHAGCEG